MEDKEENRNKEKRLSGSRKLKIVKIAIFVVLGVGVLFIMYPTITNVISDVRKAGTLSEWEAQKEASSEEEAVSEDITTEDDGESDVIVEEPEILSDVIEEEAVDYSVLTADDFFPLKIIIPKIDLEWIVNEGSDRQTLYEGPGHIIDTPLPGDVGRCTFSGHRTTYGAPFNKIDDLVEGDLIYLETIKGEIFTYAVTGLEVVYPKDVYILEGSEKRELLLTSCNPEYSAAERIIVISELVNMYPVGSEL
jgi:LPXTG-site transpeptidase (sortase) family protein